MCGLDCLDLYRLDLEINATNWPASEITLIQTDEHPAPACQSGDFDGAARTFGNITPWVGDGVGLSVPLPGDWHAHVLSKIMRVVLLSVCFFLCHLHFVSCIALFFCPMVASAHSLSSLILCGY